MSIPVTPALKKNLQKIRPALTVTTDTVAAEIIAFLQSKTQDIKTVISQLGNNADTLALQKNRCLNVIAILEEAGGITVRARNYVTPHQGTEKFSAEIQELKTMFTSTIKKLDTYVSAASDNNINLLYGGKLITQFDDNENGALVTHGIPLDSQSLGFRTPDFSTVLSVQNSRIDVMNAIDMVVTLRNTIASDIAFIKSGFIFSNSTIDTATHAIDLFNKDTKASEAEAILSLNKHNYMGDDPLAEPPQQEILNSFAASPNMEEI